MEDQGSRNGFAVETVALLLIERCLTMESSGAIWTATLRLFLWSSSDFHGRQITLSSEFEQLEPVKLPDDCLVVTFAGS